MWCVEKCIWWMRSGDMWDDVCETWVVVRNNSFVWFVLFYFIQSLFLWTKRQHRECSNRLSHEIMGSQFTECVITTIIHTLHTMKDSDRVKYMKDGRVREFDKPLIIIKSTLMKCMELGLMLEKEDWALQS